MERQDRGFPQKPKLKSFGERIEVNTPRVREEITNMEFHPVADLFPMMAGPEFTAFCADIKLNGLREAIWTHNDMIIDGRNRYKACLETGESLRFQDWNGKGSLVSFVVSLNLKRRHLSESQRAMVAAKLANVDGSGRPKEIASIEAIISQGDAAEMLSVSRASVQRAAKVQKDGVHELTEKVEAGDLSVTAAAKIAELPKGKQKRIIRRGRDAGKKILTKLKTRSMERMIKTGSHCLGCDPDAVFTTETVSAFMQTLAARSSRFAPFFSDVVEELELEKISDTTRSNYDVILKAIDAGLQEKTDLHKASGMDRDDFNHTIAVMLDYEMIEALSQGGKTDAARGAAKTIYRRKEKAEEQVRELEYVAMDFD